VGGDSQSGCFLRRSARKFVPLRWEIPKTKIGSLDDEGALKRFLALIIFQYYRINLKTWILQFYEEDTGLSWIMVSSTKSKNEV